MSDTEAPFTLRGFVSLIELAKERFAFAPFSDIPWGSSFLLWRHDVDFSLNRAHQCAVVEHRLAVVATYFINPTSAFYNPLEKSQSQLIARISEMGHRIGLHFDANGVSLSDLDAAIQAQRVTLERICGVNVEAVSFHNPKPDHLMNDAETYGDGLINAYSSTLMQGVTYCSDSNGYWRHRSLKDVINDPSVRQLQALTHPAWWQDTEMPPRSRIFRSVYGRASSVMTEYDGLLVRDGRENRSGDVRLPTRRSASADNEAESAQRTVIDFLWHAEAFGALWAYLFAVLSDLERKREEREGSQKRPTGADGQPGSSSTYAPRESRIAESSLLTLADLTAMSLDEARAECVKLMSIITSQQEA